MIVEMTKIEAGVAVLGGSRIGDLRSYDPRTETDYNRLPLHGEIPVILTELNKFIGTTPVAEIWNTSCIDGIPCSIKIKTMAGQFFIISILDPLTTTNSDVTIN